MKEVKAIIRPFMLDHILDALSGIDGLPALNLSDVRVVGTEGAGHEQVVKTKLEVMVPDHLADVVVRAVREAARTGHAGDGGVFVISLEEAVSIRSGEGGVHDGT